MTFIRDDLSGAIINTDDNYYKMILAKREEKQKSAKLQDELDCLKSELSEIKDLLNQVLNGKKYG